MAHPMPMTDMALSAARQALVDHANAVFSMEPSSGGAFEAFEDGGMGSFKVLPPPAVKDAERLAGEWGYTDLDGMGVLISVFSRDGRHVSSFDFWRYDFEPLKAFPEPNDLAPVDRTRA